MKIIINKIWHIGFLCIILGFTQLVFIQVFDEESSYVFFMTIPFFLKIFLALYSIPTHYYEVSKYSFLDTTLDRLPFGLDRIFLDGMSISDYYWIERRLLQRGVIEKHTKTYLLAEKFDRIPPWLSAAIIILVINLILYALRWDDFTLIYSHYY